MYNCQYKDSSVNKYPAGAELLKTPFLKGNKNYGGKKDD